MQFEQQKVGDYISKPYQCQTSAGQLTLTTKLTHSLSNSQCRAGNDVGRSNTFLVVVVHRKLPALIGHHLLDLNERYKL